jgi:hypothetical protein
MKNTRQRIAKKYPRKHRVDAVENNGKQERDGEPSSESSDEHEFYVYSTKRPLTSQIHGFFHWK